MALKVQMVLLTLYHTISRSLPSVLKLHLRVTVSPTTTGGSGSMVTVKYPERRKNKNISPSEVNVDNSNGIYVFYVL